MMRRLWRSFGLAGGAAAWIALCGCASPKLGNTFRVAPGDGPRAFEESRAVLREYNFPLARVDAAGGILTAGPKRSAGLFTPWDQEQTSLSLEAQDMLHQHERSVRIEFEDEPGVDAAGVDGGTSPSTHGASKIGRVLVWISRAVTPDVQISPRLPGWRSQANDPLLERRGLGWRSMNPLTRDEGLEGRLAEEIARRLVTNGPLDAGE